MTSSQPVRRVTKDLLERTLSMGDVARLAGVAPSAVRFYERHGVVTAYRTSGNQRRFLPVAVCRIRVARVAQRVGMTVREIAEVLGTLPEDCGPDDWDRIGRRLVAEGEARIRRLERVVKEISVNEELCSINLRIEA